MNPRKACGQGKRASFLEARYPSVLAMGIEGGCAPTEFLTLPGERPLVWSLRKVKPARW